MSIEEQNKIIAIFMHGGKNGFVNGILDSPQLHLTYHENWNALMSVVDKINHISDNDFGRIDVIIYKNTCHINDEREIIVETGARKNELLISVVYRAILEFIILFNTK